MRILIVSPTIGEGFGQERVARDSSTLLREAGHHVSFLTEKILHTPPDNDGLEIVTGIHTLNWLSPPALVREKLNLAKEAIARLAPDIIHFYDQFDYRLMDWCQQNYPTMLTSHTVAPSCPSSTRHISPKGVCEQKSGWKCLINHRKYDCLNFLKSPLHRAHAIENHLRRQKVIKKFPVVGAISKFVRKTLLQDGWDPHRVHLLYNPIEIPSLTIEKSTTPLLVTACRLSHHKGVGIFIQALSKMQSLPWSTRICGDGPLLDGLKQMTVSLHLQDRIEFTGVLSFSEMRKTMAQATLLVQPNVGPEPFGLSVAEAAALGTPVVGFDLPAINEIVVPGKTGLLATELSSDVLAATLCEALTHPTLQESTQDHGPAHIRDLFSKEAHLKQSLFLYRLCQDQLSHKSQLSLNY